MELIIGIAGGIIGLVGVVAAVIMYFRSKKSMEEVKDEIIGEIREQSEPAQKAIAEVKQDVIVIGRSASDVQQIVDAMPVSASTQSAKQKILASGTASADIQRNIETIEVYLRDIVGVEDLEVTAKAFRIGTFEEGIDLEPPKKPGSDDR